MVISHIFQPINIYGGVRVSPEFVDYDQWHICNKQFRSSRIKQGLLTDKDMDTKTGVRIYTGDDNTPGVY